MSNIRVEKTLLTVQYVARKFYGSTGAVIEASGDTKEEAKENLKKACAKYRQKPLVVQKNFSGGDMTFNSPGYQAVNNGMSVQYVYNDDRQAPIYKANV